jgi:DNA-binding MarR family transcriptional regulator
MSPNPQALYGLIREIRGAFQELKALGDRLHAERGLTASMRAVLEHLSDEGPASVPQIARAKSVSRQHIQTIVDDLKAEEMVISQANPAHRRSPLIAPSPKGALVFAEARAAEASSLLKLSQRLDGPAVEHSAATLRALRGAIADLKEEEERG